MTRVRIFVSHSHQDNEWCRPFVEALKAVGYDVWYDETGLTGRAAWIATIQREVQDRDLFLVVITPEAWASPWVQDELQLAIATRRRILPVLLRNTQVDGFLLTTQWVTVVGEEPQAASRPVIVAIEAPPAPGRSAAPQAATETLDDLITLCKSQQVEQRYTEALSACDRALALAPDNMDVLRIKGDILLYRVGQRKQAAAVYAHALSLLDPADPASSQDIDAFGPEVIQGSDNPTIIAQAYRAISEARRLSKAGSRVTPDGEAPLSLYLADAISRLRDLGAREDIPSLVADYDGGGDAAHVLHALVQAELIDLALQLGSRFHLERDVVIYLAAKHQDAAVQQAAKVQSEDDRIAVLMSLYETVDRSEDTADLEQTIDRLCRTWFGYPPSRSTCSRKEASYLSIWSTALKKLDQQHEAAVVEKLRSRLWR